MSDTSTAHELFAEWWEKKGRGLAAVQGPSGIRLDDESIVCAAMYIDRDFYQWFLLDVRPPGGAVIDYLAVFYDTAWHEGEGRVEVEWRNKPIRFHDPASGPMHDWRRHVDHFEEVLVWFAEWMKERTYAANERLERGRE